MTDKKSTRFLVVKHGTPTLIYDRRHWFRGNYECDFEYHCQPMTKAEARAAALSLPDGSTICELVPVEV